MQDHSHTPAGDLPGDHAGSPDPDRADSEVRGMSGDFPEVTLSLTPSGLLLALLLFYKRTISPWLPRACRFTPTCSVYAARAIQLHGAWKGSLLAIGRLLRCQPFCRGGYDPVPGDVPRAKN